MPSTQPLQPTYLDIPRPWKVISKLVKTARHDPICRIERLLNAIAVMNIDVDVEHTRMMAEVVKSQD